MSKIIHVEATASVNAPAANVYHLIADYHDGHARIIPPKYFRNLKVLKGGLGGGTEIGFEIIAFGKSYPAFGVVTEPEPGRRIVETYPHTGVVTTFIVESTGPSASRVTIATDMPPRAGIGGWFERLLMPGYLKKVYAEELTLIGEQAGLA